MARDFPEKYDDPLYASLDAKTEQKLGLPVGLLSSVRSNGEKSNHSATNDLGTFSSYQFIPATRKAILDKYDLDVSLSPENASEGAGLLLKEGLDRNKGDASQAVGEYIGGLDRKQWGKTTQAYINRVMVGQSGAKKDALSEGFAKFMADNPAVPAAKPAAAPVAPAEDKLSAGFGQWLQNQGPKPGAEAIPVEPGANTTPTHTPETSIGDKIIGAGEAALSTATGLTGGALGMAGGAIGATAGAILDGSFGTPQAMQAVEQAAGEGAQALTYAPRTASGQAQTEAVGNVMQAAIPVMPLTGELGALARAGSVARPTAAAIPAVAREVAQTGANAARTGVEAVAGKVNQVIGREPAAARPTPGTMGSIGAAGTDMATMRAEMGASELPVPINLTRGQATRDYDALRFEAETAKTPMVGQPIRERYMEQNNAMLKNFDMFVDQTGAEAPGLRAVGQAVDKALVDRYRRDKIAVRVAYKDAEKAGELAAPVSLVPLVDYLNKAAPEASSAPLLNTARAVAKDLGIATEVNGVLVPVSTTRASSLMNDRPVMATTLKTAEDFRKAINRNAGYDPANVYQAVKLKELVDAATEGQGGDVYRAARALRTRLAENYENRANINKLVTTKRGMADRQVALEDVFDHTILKGSLDDVRNVRRILQTGGEDGKQAWKELQGQTVKYIRDEATRNVARDELNNPIVSPAGLEKAIKTLDADGRLDFIFGKKGAEQMRVINELAKLVKTFPPGAVNTSNTASVLLAAMTEAGVNGSLTGLPIPVMSALRGLNVYVKNRRLQQQVREALGIDKTPKIQSAPPPGEILH